MQAVSERPFGLVIMSAVDFDIEIKREEDPYQCFLVDVRDRDI